ncbi:MAG TPA: alpha/beta fold hydrolase [Burkholderiales bacterium]|nr:alpha/beta fold hydrolase [Burkholderiales bacterium]
MSTRDHHVDIAVAGQHIAGTLVSPATSIPGVLFVHGWGGSQQQYVARAREIAALGCIGLTFDLRGHARTDSQQETVSRQDNLEDVFAAYDELVSHPNVDADSVAVVGSSYGGYLAALLTEHRPARWLALRVPALYKDTGWELPKKQLHKDPDLPAYRRRHVRPQDNRALKACAAFRGDVLIVESENDDTVPHRVIENYREACKHAHSLTYRIIEGADHGLSMEPAQRAYTSILVNWLTEMVLGARQQAPVAQGSARAGAAPVEAEPHRG